MTHYKLLIIVKYLILNKLTFLQHWHAN